MKRIQAGTTRPISWINSGASPSAVSFSVLNGEDSAVSSVSMTNSGDGHYYSFVTFPTSEGFYVGKFQASISGLPYINRIPFRTVFQEVD